MITSKLTTKAQTTIPQSVRAALRLKEGDEIAYEIEENRVILTKARAGMIEDPFATFGEWESEADRKAPSSGFHFLIPIERRGNIARRSSSPMAGLATATVCFGSP